MIVDTQVQRRNVEWPFKPGVPTATQRHPSRFRAEDDRGELDLDRSRFCSHEQAERRQLRMERS
jgi:hypothetical protein